MANNLRRIRKEQGLTQVQLAQKAGVCKNTVYHIERVTNKPGVDAVWLLAEALGVTMNDLCYGGDDEQT